MERRIKLAAVAGLGAILMSISASAQQKSLKDQLVGTWIYVSSTSTRADGKKMMTARTSKGW